MKLVYGRAGSGKSNYCMNEIKRFIDEGFSKALIYIVPEQYSLMAEFELSKMLNNNGTINIQVLTFKRLAYRVFNELGFMKTPFSKASKNMLIYHIMHEHEKNLVLLKGVDRNRGLVDTVSDIISEFKRYNVSYDMIENLDIKNEYLKIKLNDIALIYRLFEEKISAEYIDIDSRLTKLSSLVSKAQMLKDAKIWIDEFDSFTPQELSIIEELEKVSDVTTTLTFSKDEELFSIVRHTYEKLKKIANLEEIDLGKSKKFNNKELFHIEQNVFNYPFIKYSKDTENIHLLIEANPYNEIKNVARIISKKVKDEVLRYENIAVLTRDIDNQKTIFNRVFTEFNIPYFFDDKKELSMQPLLSLITSLFDIITKNFKYESVFTYLKSGFTNIQDINDIDLIENYVLQYGIKGLSRWQNKWEYPHDELDKINVIREEIIEPIIKFKESMSGRKTVKEIATNLYNFLIELNVYNILKDKVDSIKNKEDVSSNELEIANTYIQVWNVLMSLIDELVLTLGNEQMSFDEFKNVLIEGISMHQIGILPTSNDHVLIGDIERTRNSNIKILFVIGINDGVFPRTFINEGFINDCERDLLFDNGIELAKNTKMQLLEENFNIYKALTTPSDELFLSYPIANNDGGALRPSTIINQIKSMFSSIDIKNNILDGNEYIINSKEAFSELLKNLRYYYDGKEIDEKWKNVYLWYMNNEPDKLSKVKSGFDYNNTIEYLDKKHSKELYGKELYGSVSRLERYANCPFSYYLKYGLKLNDRKVYKLDTPDVGSFLHEIIDAFSKYFTEKNISLRDVSKEEADKVVSELVDDTLKDFKNNIFNSSNQMKMLASKLKRVVKRMVWILINHIKSGDFEVVGTEIGFGKEKQFSAVEIDLGENNKLVLTGVIDRLDIAKTDDGKYIRIIDYKSYNKELKLSDIYYGLQLQLLVYMDASLNNSDKYDNSVTSESELLPGGMLYLKLDDPLIKTKGDMSIQEIEDEISKKLRMKGVILADAKLLKAMDSQMINESSVLDLTLKKDGSYSSKVPGISKEQFDGLIKHMNDILKQMGNEILNGNIKNEPVKKKDQTACDYCDYRLICNFDRDLGNKYRIINDLKNEDVLKNI